MITCQLHIGRWKDKCDYERVRRDGLKIDPYHDDGTLDIANYIHG